MFIMAKYGGETQDKGPLKQCKTTHSYKNVLLCMCIYSTDIFRTREMSIGMVHKKVSPFSMSLNK